ncbi:LuxR family transcriptional regulator [Pontibacillus halophilus JSM 076056 = DSM 19796]|uniref:LuxR family transcriptional regulator n=1 Tax=Pontibacillus halophilus JSM 076056 = DSM 19796 TaxID=1385510 RepID=A0A0A5I5J4_9BACI|nr:response regulator transcription factor [Pontibacillus halophilus]KGX91097.1 LuxR family transcriptional regulator [Pontibacillus halophilus JSM 076056 = DSM 19796]
MIRILLVDDHPSVGEGTKVIIEREADMEVTIVESPIEAIERVENAEFECMLFDLKMPGMNGIELVKKVRSMGVHVPILIYTGHDIGPYFNTLVKAGASGFINKTERKEELIRSIRSAMNGKVLLPISLFKELRRMEVQVEEAKEEEEASEEISITQKEQELLKRLAEGKSNKEIASMYYKSQRTIEYNLTDLFKKLKVKSRAEAVLKSKQWGIIGEEIE